MEFQFMNWLDVYAQLADRINRVRGMNNYVTMIVHAVLARVIDCTWHLGSLDGGPPAYF